MGNYLLAHLSPPLTYHPHTSGPLLLCFFLFALRKNNLLGIKAVRMHCGASENCDISSNDMNTRIGI